MSGHYAGPLRDEPLAVELYNTVYAAAGAALDGLATVSSAHAWLTGLESRLPLAHVPGAWPALEELVALRSHVRTALGAVVTGGGQDPVTIEALNLTSARAPSAAAAFWTSPSVLAPGQAFPGATRSDIVLATLAADAIALLTGPQKDDLRACGAPGCVLLYLKDHRRRAWCSNTCGNRARQARHYERARRS
jgi:predicted RNA-binding Zn ribbon-like protein